MAAGPSPHNVLLLQISDGLSREDLDSLLFCCSDVVPESKKVRRGTDLFTALKHRGLLCPGQYSYLRESLAAIGRVDLSRKLPSELESVLAQVSSHDKSLVHSCQTKAKFSPPSEDKSVLSGLTSTISSRVKFLQIAECLSSEDASKLAYLCLGEDSSELSATGVLLKLEKAHIIDPSHPETLASLLHCIERRDLVCSLLSTQNPLHVHSLDHSHQLLNLKASMFTDKRSHYAFQRRLLNTIASSDQFVVEEQIVKPMLIKLVQSYKHSTVHRLCAASQEAFQKTKRFDDLIRSTLPGAFDLYEAYTGLFYHFLTCDEGVIDLNTVRPLFTKCHDWYSRFEEQVKEFSWNNLLRENVQKDLTQRRTPFGSPAHKAMNCIYDIASELADREKVESLTKEVDRNIYILNCLFHGFSFRLVMTQWLKSILCLLATKDSSILYSPDVLRETLLQVVEKHRDQISSCYNRLAAVLGEELMGRMSEALLKDGVDIRPPQPNDLNDDAGVTESGAYTYVANVRTLLFLDLFSLLRLSYFGSGEVDFCNVFSGMRDLHVGIMTSSYFIPCTMTLYQNLIRAYEDQIDCFRDRVLKSNSQCYPVLTQLISL